MHTRAAAFTLIELMAALGILAILAALASPLYTRYSVGTHRAMAQADLLRCAQGMERHASLTFSYLSAIDSDGDGAGDLDSGRVTPNICTPMSTHYRIDLAKDRFTGFLLRASPVRPGNVVDGDGDLALDGAAGRFWDRNDDGEFGPGEDMWE